MISYSIAFISGKGGSGKTTLSLSMASLLAECGFKVLLIDCDFNTNGATYFFEKELVNHEEQELLSFYKICSSDQWSRLHAMKALSVSYDFIPSVTQIRSEFSMPPEMTAVKHLLFRDILDSFKNQYDFVLFDCQAGYSEALELILPCVDLSLTVMEADAVSSSAARALFWRIGRFIQDKKSFQVFNKATAEEQEVYSKVSGGTLFTNLGCISFDWQVRKAFSMLNAPSINNLGLEYTKQLYQLCNDLFGDSNALKKLEPFQTKIELLEATEDEEHMIAKMNAFSDSFSNDTKSDTPRKRTIDFFSSIFPLLSMIAVSFLVFIPNIIMTNTSSSTSQIIIVLSIIIVFMILFLSFSVLQKRNDKKYQKTTKRIVLSNLESELNTIREKKVALKKKYAQQQIDSKEAETPNKVSSKRKKRQK